MKRIISFIVVAASLLPAYADRYVYTFRNTPVSKALVAISHDHPSLNLSFIYKNLDKYTTSSTISTDDPGEAIRKVVGMNPITVTEKKGTYYVEALQKGKYVYTGRTVGTNGEPVVAASVLLLSPKDSTVLTYGFTDEGGFFSIPCDHKRVIGKITSTGYRPRIEKFRQFALGDILMQQQQIYLRAIEVEGQTSQYFSDRDVFTPTSRQKNTAQDGIDLLRRMSIPQLKVGIADKGVTTSSGDQVAIYINYMKASSEELEGMKTSDVRKVEFMYSPSDSRFMGDRNVINFIIQPYVYGGYTKLRLSESFFTGLASNGSVYSKFTYKKITYDLYAGSRNINNHHNGFHDESTYLLSPDGGSREWVARRESLSGSHLVSNAIPVSFRASYSSKNFQMKNTVSYNYRETPHDDSSGALNFTPSIVDDGSYKSVKDGSSHAVAYSGNFNLTLPDGYALTLNPVVSYQRNILGSHYETDVLSILNDACEHTTDFSVMGIARKKVSDRHYFYLRGFGGHSNFKVEYSGNTTAADKIMENWMGGRSSMDISPINCRRI